MPLTKVSAGVIAANAVQDSVGSQSITGDKLGLTAINANNIVNASITGAKIALGTITGDDIATGQITGNLLTANCVSGNNIVSGLALTGNVSVTGNVIVGSGTAANPAISVVGDTDTGIYFPSANTIGFTRGGIQVGEFDSTSIANFKFNSGFGSVGTAYGCRAWANFDGSGTPSIRGTGNVSSITDNGTGQYTVNFATAMPDTNYSAIGSCSVIGSVSSYTIVATTGSGTTTYGIHSTSGVGINATVGSTGNNTDPETVQVAIFR